jgi:hypothetical protein
MMLIQAFRYSMSLRQTQTSTLQSMIPRMQVTIPAEMHLKTLTVYCLSGRPHNSRFVELQNIAALHCSILGYYGVRKIRVTTLLAFESTANKPSSMRFKVCLVNKERA